MTDFERAIMAYANFMGVNAKEAREDAENIIQDNMRTEGWTREFAEATFIEDTLDGMEATVDEMTQAAKDNGTDKVNAKAVDAYGKKRARTRKPNDVKRGVITTLYEFLSKVYEWAQDVSIENPERQIDFTIENRHFSLTLTEHRPKKAKN